MEETEDYVMTLFDRLEMISKTINANGENKFYVSYSGGKDSVVLSRLIDMALPNNSIPRVYINTGIEYKDMVDFVTDQAKIDPRIVMIRPSKPIISVLKEYGYPFKSKEHSNYLSIYQHSGLTKTPRNYVGLGTKTSFICPKCLRYQFTPNFNIKVSDKCCSKLKKQPAAKWAKEHNKTIVITGMRRGEGGVRASRTSGCAIFNDKRSLVKFHPLFPVSEAFEEWFIESENLKLCKLYYPPFNFKRTGCKGCPFALDLKDQLEIMKQYLPAEEAQCELIWQPIYSEYRRINYRLGVDKHR